MMAARLHPKARQELLEVVEYYLAIDSALGVAFLETFLKHKAQIEENPLLYRIRSNGARRVNLKPKFSEYYIAYDLREDEVLIFAVGHAKRRPSYWRRRLSEPESGA